MRKIFLCIFACCAISAAYSQQADSLKILTKEDYLKKSKQQKTAAWVLLGAAGLGIAVAAPGDVDFSTLGTIVIAAGLATVSSIVLFIASSKNKKKANSFSIHLKADRGLYSLTPSSMRARPQLQFKWSLSR
jgi:hypothetical protein